MKYTKLAIEKSIEGGWEPDFGGYYLYLLYPAEGDTIRKLLGVDAQPLSDIALDPDFWRALGKSLGWFEDIATSPSGDTHWRKEWHNLISHLADGNDIESYFEQLLKSNNE